jgi:hypothetical protein
MNLKFFRLPLLLIATFFSSSAMAIDTGEPFLCASIQVNECVDGRGCESVLAESVNAPTFFRVDVKKKQINVYRDAPPSKVLAQSEVEGRLILMGAEDGSENQPDGTGWTLSIEQDSGRFVLAASVLQGAIVVFGACTEI